MNGLRVMNQLIRCQQQRDYSEHPDYWRDDEELEEQELTGEGEEEDQ